MSIRKSDYDIQGQAGTLNQQGLRAPVYGHWREGSRIPPQMQGPAQRSLQVLLQDWPMEGVPPRCSRTLVWMGIQEVQPGGKGRLSPVMENVRTSVFIRVLHTPLSFLPLPVPLSSAKLSLTKGYLPGF